MVDTIGRCIDCDRCPMAGLCHVGNRFDRANFVRRRQRITVHCGDCDYRVCAGCVGLLERRAGEIKVMNKSDVFILLAVAISFVLSAYLWFTGSREEGVFTAIWVPSILCFGIYFKLIRIEGTS